MQLDPVGPTGLDSWQQIVTAGIGQTQLTTIDQLFCQLIGDNNSTDAVLIKRPVCIRLNILMCKVSNDATMKSMISPYSKWSTTFASLKIFKDIKIIQNLVLLAPAESANSM